MPLLDLVLWKNLSGTLNQIGGNWIWKICTGQRGNFLERHIFMGGNQEVNYSSVWPCSFLWVCFLNKEMVIKSILHLEFWFQERNMLEIQQRLLLLAILTIILSEKGQ